MKENLDIFPALYYPLFKQNISKAESEEYGIEKFIKIHYLIIKKLQEILLIKKKVILFLGQGIRIKNGEVKKINWFQPKELNWDKEGKFVNDYWIKLIEYTKNKLSDNTEINFLNLFLVKYITINNKQTLKFEIY